MPTKANSRYAPVSIRDSPATQHEVDSPVVWTRGWQAPAMMLFLFVCGVSVTIGHHEFNRYLSGKDVRDIETMAGEFATQIWILRYGTAFTFLEKTLFASSVAIAYKQHIWITLSDKGNSVSTINAIFAATSDIIALLNPRLIKSSFTSALMALVIWYIYPVTYSVDTVNNQTPLGAFP